MLSKTLILCLLAAAPLSADFGLDGPPRSSASLRLDSPEAALSIRFSSLRDQELRQVSLYCPASLNAPSLLLSIQEDKQGRPSGIPLATASWVPWRQSWSSLAFQGVPLKRGQVYHAVVEFDRLRGGGHPVGSISAEHHAELAALSPSSQALPLYGTQDKALGMLTRGKSGAWKDSGLAPVFMLRAADGQLQGQSYGEPLVAPIAGSQSVAQVLHFNCGSTLKSLKVLLRRVGQPTSPLRIQIHKHDYQKHVTVLLWEGDFAQASELGKDWSWRHWELPETAPKNFAPECYYFAFSAASGRLEDGHCADCYEISGLKTWPGASGAQDLTFDGGAHRSRAATRKGSEPWLDDFDGDLNLVAIGTHCEERSAELSVQPLPTPGWIFDPYRAPR